MVLETLSVGVVIPSLGILMNEAYFEQFVFLHQILEDWGHPSHETLILLGLSGLATAFLVKNLYLYFQVQCLGTFVFSAQREIALSLFKKYLSLGYFFHLKANSANLIRNLTTEVSHYCSFFLMPTINLITECLVIISLLSLILFMEPQGAFFLIIILGSLVFLFVRATNRVVGRWGSMRLDAEGEKLKHLQHGFGGLKEILLSGRVEYFLRRFHRPNQLAGLMTKREYIFQYVPKLGVETIAIFGLVGMCAFLIKKGNSNEEVVHILGLMATAGFRMIPSFSRILNNLQSIRYGWASVSVLNKEFMQQSRSSSNNDKNRTEPAIVELKFKKELRLSNVSYFYEEKSQNILKDLSFVISKGEIVGFAGESGSGKSTLANLILGLLHPSQGEVMIDNVVLTDQNCSKWHTMIGYVPQEVFLLDDTIRRNIAFGLDDQEINDNRINEVIQMVKLDVFVKTTSDGLDLLLGERGTRLSGGQRQRIGIARALYHDPEVLILDEATSSLDNETEDEIFATLEPLKKNKTILIIAHGSKALNFCPRILFLKNGTVEEL